MMCGYKKKVYFVEWKGAVRLYSVTITVIITNIALGTVNIVHV